MRRREEDSVLEERKKKQREAGETMSQVSQEENKKVEGANLFKMTIVMGEYSTLKMPVFHGYGKEDPKQHWFVSEAVWSIKQTTDNHVNIALLETTSRVHALVWYMKFKSIAPTRVGKTLVEIKQVLFKEF